MIDLTATDEGVLLLVKVRAGARRTALVGGSQGVLRIDVTAAPERGKANRSVIEVIARALGIPKSAVEIVSGATSPQKKLLIRNLTIDLVQKALA